jgi:hypothetical protein
MQQPQEANRRRAGNGLVMVIAGSDVSITRQLPGGSGSAEISVLRYRGGAFSFWVGRSATDAAGYIADPKLTLLDDSRAVLTNDENSVDGSSAVIDHTSRDARVGALHASSRRRRTATKSARYSAGRLPALGQRRSMTAA